MILLHPDCENPPIANVRVVSHYDEDVRLLERRISRRVGEKAMVNTAGATQQARKSRQAVAAKLREGQQKVAKVVLCLSVSVCVCLSNHSLSLVLSPSHARALSLSVTVSLSFVRLLSRSLSLSPARSFSRFQALSHTH